DVFMRRAVRISHHKSQQTAAPLIPAKPTIANLRTAAGGLATVHPSSILRAIDDESRRQQMQAFIEDLRKIAPLIHRAGKAA
ncbi:MAG TPA: hypothetical protein VGU64_03000, partial [Terriglobales bacterium]|nr:hypothetical protein [Terriglobales bacterium]